MRWYGTIGFAKTEETIDGVWEEVITERSYYGEVTRNTSRYQQSKQLNDNLTISNSFSVVADAYAYDNFHAIRYIVWMGTKWKVISAEVAHPRIMLEIGDVYNGDEGPQTQTA